MVLTPFPKMAEREEEDACSGESSRVLNFREEARQSLAEVAYAIGEGVLSQKLHNDSEGAYCNITTLEGKRFCVRLSWRGFEVRDGGVVEKEKRERDRFP